NMEENSENLMNCTNCGAPMKLLLDRQHFFCEYCTTIYFPEENDDGILVLEHNSDTSCPVCNIPLVYGFIDRTQTLYCQNCRGILIDQEVFLMVIDYLRAKSSAPSITPPPVDLEELNRKIRCPNCSRRMSTHLYGGPGNLVVDNCIHCSLLWLDNNEFTRIIRAPGREPRIEPEEEEQ
ncbi:MAG: zf-TFIIB domain-containing protein, partial [Chloroflexota bacterium]